MSIFRCIVPNAVPCVDIKEFDEKTGQRLDKPKKAYKSVKKGGTVSWVDLCSRKHFIAVDDAAKRLNKEDFKKMKIELKDLNVELPDDATFAECADSLAALKASKTNSNANVKRRFFAPSEEADKELTNAELKAKLDDLGVEYPAVVNKAKLKELLAGAEKD
jgi:hypothetical protein